MDEEQTENQGPVGPRGHEGEKGEPGWVDLAPDICRQRIVIEGTLHSPFTPEQMTEYCIDVTKVLNMTAVTAPVCNFDSQYGWCAYMHWKESGMHIYAWDDRKPPFFSIDIYTCKSFDPWDAGRYTEEFFGEQLIKMCWKE
jgi:S-adenosylmethionine decarboxylase